MSKFAGIAQSACMQRLLEQAVQISKLPRPVLIRGERGAGKELLARFLHDCSARAQAPFVAVNCAAFTDALMDAELFGHEAGGFTGATDTRLGKLELAHSGSLFLDEIGNMSPRLQDRILRVIEYQSFQRVRGNQTVQVDVRIISATNADLESLMHDGLFRPDLYDRLTFAELYLPALRTRRSDIPHLVVDFVQALHREIPNLPPRTFTRETMEALMSYHWPGNIRELKNVVERLFVSGSSEKIVPPDLPSEIAGAPPIVGDGFHQQVEALRRELILRALRQTNGNQRAAAAALDMSYHQFRHYYRKYQS